MAKTKKKAPAPTVGPDTAPPTDGPTVHAPMVQVKFLRSHPKFAYFAGESGEMTRENFDKYSQDGPFFEEVKGKKATQPDAE